MNNPEAFVLTSDVLEYVDDEEKPSMLTYEIIDFIPSSSGRIYHLDDSSEVLKYFTQADVDKFKIMFQPSLSTAEAESFFKFKG